MTDDSNSEFEKLKIDRQRRAMAGTGHTRTGNGDSGMYRRILEALIVVTVVALVTAVWNLTQTVALLQASQAALETSTRRDIDRLERRQDSLEGKLVRGGPDALDQ